MDSDPLPMLEKSDALQRHEVHGNTQETGFDFRHLPSGAKRIKSMDGKAQKTTITQSLRDFPKSEIRPCQTHSLGMKRSSIRFQVWTVTALLTMLASHLARADGGIIRL